MNPETICLQWLIREDQLIINISCDGGQNWRIFGDALPARSNGFQYHDIYHILFKLRLGWSHVYDVLFLGHTQITPVLLREEAVCLNDIVVHNHRASVEWAAEICPWMGKDVQALERCLREARETMAFIQALCDQHRCAFVVVGQERCHVRLRL